MKKGLIITFSIIGAALLGATVASAIELGLNKGALNLLLRNISANDFYIPVPEWKGKSYERVPYSNVSKSDYLDLYVPEKEDGEKPPLFVAIHGGAFLYNDSQSRQAKQMFQDIRAAGYACASINYRLASEAKYPACIEDCKAAIKFLKAHAEQYGYDDGKIAVWGESAGGYLASMLATTDNDEFSSLPYIDEKKETTYTAEVGALVDFYGIIDFEKYTSDFEKLGYPRWLLNMVGSNDPSEKTNYTHQFINGNIYEFDEQRLYEMSATKHVEKRFDRKDFKVYISHGDVDITVPYLQSTRLRDAFIEKLGEANVTFRLEKGRKHADDRFYTHENLAPVRDFLKDYYKK
ncbi:MAG: alpha/beta hydrolase [Bacilli bacterium]|nr:alpha/beta hydrolase [Bacilli bacterium]